MRQEGRRQEAREKRQQATGNKAVIVGYVPDASCDDCLVAYYLFPIASSLLPLAFFPLASCLLPLAFFLQWDGLFEA